MIRCTNCNKIFSLGAQLIRGLRVFAFCTGACACRWNRIHPDPKVPSQLSFDRT